MDRFANICKPNFKAQHNTKYMPMSISHSPSVSALSTSTSQRTAGLTVIQRRVRALPITTCPALSTAYESRGVVVSALQHTIQSNVWTVDAFFTPILVCVIANRHVLTPSEWLRRWVWPNDTLIARFNQSRDLSANELSATAMTLAVSCTTTLDWTQGWLANNYWWCSIYWWLFC